MTEKEEAITYFESEKKRLEAFITVYPSPDTIGYQAATKEISFYEMAISALSEELSEDGTLTVHVSDGSKVKRVFVMGDNIFGGLYYPDSDFDGMTNGEVIRAMFPNSKTETISFNGIRLYIDDEAHTKIADFTYRWWNAPYQKGGE